MLSFLKKVLWVVLLWVCAAPVLKISGGAEVYAQVDTAWVRRYNGPSDSSDVAKAITVDHSGNVYVTGESRGSGTLEDYATIKYLPNGDTAWVRRYNGSWNKTDKAVAIAVDDSGNVYVTGSSLDTYSGYDYVTIKYHANGDTAWVQRYKGPLSNDYAYDMVVDASGNVYVTGSSSGSGTGDDYATIKYNTNGDTTWLRRYDGPGNNSDYTSAIAVDDSGYVYVSGASYGIGTSADYATVKYYPSGDTAWVRRYNGVGSNSDYAKAVAVDDSGNVYVTGYTNNGSNIDYATVKYYSNGDTAWARIFNGPGNDNDYASAIAVDGSGNVYVTGTSRGSGTYDDFATIKYYPNGDTVWVRRYNGLANDRDAAYAIALDDSDNIYVNGYSWASGTSYDYTTVKYYSNGEIAWIFRYNGPPGNAGDNSDSPKDLAIDDFGNVYVTGGSAGIGTNYDYATIKYVQSPSGVEEETQVLEKPLELSLAQNYPNPFNLSTTLHFTVYSPQPTVRSPIPTTLKIYNVLGEVVRTLVDEPKGAGDYAVQWDGKNDKGEQLSSGVYFYELKLGNQTSAKKMILLK